MEAWEIMIEIIYREDDKSSEEISVKLPKNIRQIGDVNGNKKIYFEQKVIDMIKEKPHYGVLLGSVKHVGNCAYIFIKVAITAISREKNVEFGDRVWAGINDDLHTYFHNQEIVGWFVSEEYKSISLENVKKIQLDNFPGNDRICMLNDMSENEENIYQYNNGVIENVGGYYIYFDKNSEFERYLSRRQALDEMFNEETRKETEKTEIEKTEKKWDIKGMVPSYMVIALLLAVIVVMNNNNQIKSIKTSLSDIAGNLVNRPVTEAESEPLKPVVEHVAGEVETTKPQETTTRKTEKKEKDTIKAEETKKEEKKAETRKAEVEAVNKTKYYIVKPGETLSDISKKVYNNITMVDKIMKVNKIKDGNLIFEGQKIILP